MEDFILSKYKSGTKRITADDELLIVDKYKEGFSGKEILKILNGKFATTKTVYDTLRRYDILGRQENRGFGNHDALIKIDSCLKAYVLGLFITDGYVVDVTPNCFQVGLQSTDMCLAEFVKDVIGGNILFIPHKNKSMKNPQTGKEYPRADMFRSVVNSKGLAESLSRYGVVPRKSDKTFLPLIEEKFMPDLIRGLIDGDGYITLAASGAPLIGLYGSCQLISQVELYLSLKLNLERQSINFRSETTFMHHLQWGSQIAAAKIYKYCGESSLRLERKWKPLEEFLKLNSLIL